MSEEFVMPQPAVDDGESSASVSDAEEAMPENRAAADVSEDEEEEEVAPAAPAPAAKSAAPVADEAEKDAPEESAAPAADGEADAPEEGALVPVEAEGKKKRGRPKEDAADKDKIVRRPRWGDKSFEDITMGDVETLVRRVTTLEKQVEANSEAAQQLKESKKRERELERELEEVGPKEVALVKAAISKQLLAQMIYVHEWNHELKNAGRDIYAYLPNVSLELLKELGGDPKTDVKKQPKFYFDKAPSKAIPPALTKEQKEKEKEQGKPGGTGLVLGGYVTLKYIKTTRELRFEANYRFGTCERKKGGGKGNKKAVKDGAGENDAEDAADDYGGAAENREAEAPAVVATGGA